MYDEVEGGWESGEEHMQFLQRASVLGDRCRPSRRTARLVAAADCVSSGGVSGERRRPGWSPLHPNHTRLAHEAERRLHYLVLHRRYWKTAASYAEAASPGGRTFMFFFPRPSCRGTALIIAGPIQAVSEVRTGRFHQDKLGSP